MNQDGSVRLPALMHLPDYGTFRLTVTGAKSIALPYDASRAKGDNWVRISFPAATAASPRLEYTWDVVAIHPGPASIEKDPRFDGYRRNFLTIFQLNPRVRALANHAASDACPLTLYEYAEMARFTPPLAENLRAMDLVRATLDRYLGGMQGYGQRGYRSEGPERDNYPHDSLDTYPSLVWAAAAYVETTKDSAWLHKNYTGIKAWADRILSDDRDGDGLIESPLSGNAGSWTPRVTLRPSNWWDTVGFGHKDAYSNAIAFRALVGMAGLARTAGRAGEAERYAQAAQRIKAAFPKTFYNPATGVLAGWKSADGKLHDYYFTFVAGLAATMGLVPDDMANRVMDRMFAKMREVGYTDFRLGLPGNLIPIRREDYVDPRTVGRRLDEGGRLRRVPVLRERRRHRLSRLLDHSGPLQPETPRRCGANPLPGPGGLRGRRVSRHRRERQIHGLEALGRHAGRLRRAAGRQLPHAAGGPYRLRQELSRP